MGLTMGEAEETAQDRKRRKNDIVALCPIWGMWMKRISK